MYPEDVQWKSLADQGYPLYEVSNHGNVRSLIKNKGILNNILLNVGYYTVHLCHNKKPKLLYVHRLVYQAFIGKIGTLTVDHKDLNKTNNHVSNLRLATKQQQIWNQPKHRDSSSKYKGVYWHTKHQTWVVYVGGKYVCRTKDPFYGAIQYNKYALEHHGKYAVLNDLVCEPFKSPHPY